ncbi:dephospho-CoA kinase [Calothrix sp. 336/3]|uniref:dephospho-CoA kinase n=1 Tax=Calothrix sp. 336/3 TaxID=1337936 RepID=UPI0004E3AB78|nr:dephospho-CoA kinase [Calothrix sp. 336/3]AKG24577.1 dephospho-CoA kinase [Calothrix sp. 336/3]
MNKRIIGLTGGIATGKTTVADYLAHTYHLPIFDADIYAREAVAPGSAILQAIATKYGEQILLDDGNLNRVKLGEIIFNQPTERSYIEGLIHPYVGDRLVTAIHHSSVNTLVLVVPLLFEAHMTNLVTEIWVVSCHPEQQLQRLMVRNHLTKSQAQARIDSQMSLTEKKKLANFILENTGNFDELCQQIDRIMQDSEKLL